MRAVALLLVVGGCNVQTGTISGGDSSCNLCHTNIGVAHTHAAVGCTDCHGGREVPEFEAPFKSAAYLQAMRDSHVQPRAGNEDKFLANGLTRGACFNGAVDPDCNGGDPNGLGSVDDAVDSEYNRDLDYVRFINPGDLRVAHASCGGGARGAGGFGGCHAEEVARVRRSMMATNASVVTAAFLGNRGRSDARGYVFDLEAVDACFRAETNSYDNNCLAARRSFPDDELGAGDPANDGLQVFAGRVTPAQGTQLSTGAITLLHGGHATRLGGIGGNPVSGQAHAAMNPPDNKTNQSALGLLSNAPLCGASPPLATVEPVDGVLRGFRAYYPLWLPGSNKNFNQVAGSTLDGAIAAFNPLGRGHGSGCTGCHMLYDNNGQPHDDDDAIQKAQRWPRLDLVNGDKFAQGMDVRQGDKQQRFYPARHQLTTRIPSRQCGLCHTFVTRVDLAYQGLAEIEEGDKLARGGDIAFTTPGGTKVRIFDSLERVNTIDNVIFNITTDPRAKAHRAALVAECEKRKLDCGNVYSADLNNNGELDADEPDISNGELLLPDRVPREASRDGRQLRIIYGGANGSTRMTDVHLERGMHCVDCHFYQDLHGDGNLYTNNWDAVEIECEDCHGYAGKRAFEVNPGQLLTSGAAGGNDLMKSRDDRGRPFFEVREGKLWQRSRVNPDLEWAVPQVADVKTRALPGGEAAPHSPQHLPSGPRDAGKLECYSCHSSTAMSCVSCHYQQNYKNQQREVFLAGTLQPAQTNFQLFGIIRSPLILGVGGGVEANRIAPFRSSMEAHVSIADCNGNTVFANLVHSNCRDGKPTSGLGVNNFMPHSVRKDVARTCETCHSVTDDKGHLLNNHLLAQTYGLGTGRLDYLGDWLLVASSTLLDVVDVKDESEAPGLTGNKNSFPGFVVGASNNAKASVRSFALTAGGTFAPRDVAMLRSFNPTLCAGENPINPDIAVVAAGAAGLHLVDVSQPDLRAPNTTSTVTTQVVPGNFVGVDHLGPDVSDPIVYAADAARGLVIVNLATLMGSPISNWPAGVPANGVRVAGSRALVAAGAAGLVIVDGNSAGAPLPMCLAGESMPCGRVAQRVAVQGAIAYLATSSGVVAVEIAGTPRVIGVAGSAAVEDVALSGHLLFAAAGAAGLQAFDVTDPAEPAPIAIDAAVGEAHGVVVGAVPTQTWVFVAAGAAGVKAVNVSTLFDPHRARQGMPAVDPAHVPLTLEARDPLAPRDPTLPLGKFTVVNFATRAPAFKIARGAALDRITDEGGRRLRDSWNPGNGVLSRARMDAMRAQSFPWSSVLAR